MLVLKSLPYDAAKAEEGLGYFPVPSSSHRPVTQGLFSTNFPKLNLYPVVVDDVISPLGQWADICHQ